MVGTAPLRRIYSLDNLDEVDKILQVRKLHVNSPTEYLRGGMAERSKAADCKSADSVYGGSNPPPPTNSTRQADLAQQVEHIHGKDGVSGSSPEVGSMFIKRSGTLHAPDRVSFGLYEAVIQSTSAT